MTTPQKRWMKFDPTFTTGNIIQLIIVAAAVFGAYSDLKGEQRVQSAAQGETARQIKAITEDVKDISNGMRNVQLDVAVLRARSTSPGATR